MILLWMKDCASTEEEELPYSPAYQIEKVLTTIAKSIMI